MKRYKVVLHTDRHVAYLGIEQQALIVLRRSGGPSDTIIPRYYAGIANTRQWALLSAFNACREHGEFEPVLDDRPKSKRP